MSIINYKAPLAVAEALEPATDMRPTQRLGDDPVTYTLGTQYRNRRKRIINTEDPGHRDSKAYPADLKAHSGISADRGLAYILRAQSAGRVDTVADNISCG